MIRVISNKSEKMLSLMYKVFQYTTKNKSVGTGLDGWGPILHICKGFFSAPQHPYWIWGTHSLPSHPMGTE
jgi:hypothetical protein